MQSMKRLWIGSLLAGTALGALSCTDGPTCGSGTIETNGECVAAGTPVTGACTGNTTFDPGTGACIPKGCVSGKPCGICGTNTTADVAPDGTVTCIGTGGPDPGNCDDFLVCPNPASGKFQVCGRLLDPETSTLLKDDATLATKLKVRFYDASVLGSAGNNVDNTPTIGTAMVDQCGRFTAGTGLAPPQLGYVAIAVDDATGNINTGDFVFTAVAVPSGANMKVDKVRAFVAKQSLVAEWGNNIISTGAYLGLFIDTSKPAPTGSPFPGAPVAHIKLQLDDSDLDPTAEFYFDDTDPLTHSMVNGALTETGPNGAGIIIGTPLGFGYGAKGLGTSSGCSFPNLPAATLPNGLFVQEHEGTCP
jgi:hypothetical protein